MLRNHRKKIIQVINAEKQTRILRHKNVSYNLTTKATNNAIKN
jgi:hypothetical protein